MAQNEFQVEVPDLPDHSTLELVKHDKSVAAPERDHALVAPEIGRQTDAPEITPGQGPETRYDDAPPEALPISAESNSAESKSIPASYARRLPSRRVNIIIVIVMTVIMSLAVGAGAGTGLSKHKSSGSSSEGAAGTVTKTALASPTPNSSPVLTDKRILDDTSLAALALPNGDRRLFFQDLSGAIRQAFYSAASKQWRADVKHVAASNARNHTPIAVVESPTMSENSTNGPFVFIGNLAILYIFANNSLACVEFVEGGWIASSEINASGYFANVSQFTAYAESRSLSVAMSSVEGTAINGLIVYEPTKGGITVLNGSFTDTDARSAIWRNISGSLPIAVQQPYLRYAAPFTFDSSGDTSILFASTFRNGTYSEFALSVLFNYFPWTTNSSLYSETTQAVGFEPSLIPFSDFVFMDVPLQTFEDTIDGPIQPTLGRVLGFWVKNQTLTPLSGDFYSKSPSPQSLFPFSRLASIVPVNSSDFFIYHQLNASSFGEERWDDSFGGWVSNSFEISMA